MKSPGNKTQAQIDREIELRKPFVPLSLRKRAMLGAMKKYELKLKNKNA